jgi:hypothetical protein
MISSRHLITLAAALSIATALPAQTFSTVADTTTAIPGKAGNFESFSSSGSIDAAGNVAFTSTPFVYIPDPFSYTQYPGVYLKTANGLSRVADDTVSGGGFTAISGVSIDNGRVGFRATDSGGSNGLYFYNGTSYTSWADTSTGIPSGTGNFDGFGASYLRGSTMTFIGNSAGYSQTGIYTTDATGTNAVKIVDLNTPIPGMSGSYGWSSQLAVTESGNIAFAANNEPGVFTLLGGYSNAGGLVTLANTTTLVPGQGVNFSKFESPPDLDGDLVLFRGYFNANADLGLYTQDIAGGDISLIVDTTMAALGGSGDFTNFRGFAADSGRIAFLGDYSGGSALYLYDNEILSRLIGTGDLVDGHTITSLSFSQEGLAGDYLVFGASFEGGSGIYSTMLVSAVPEPSTYALIVGVFFLGLTVWRRRNAA